MTIEEKWKQFEGSIKKDKLNNPDIVMHCMRYAFFCGVETGMDYPTYEQEFRKELTEQFKSMFLQFK